MHSEETDTELSATLARLVVSAHRLTRLAAHETADPESPATWRTLGVLTAHGSVSLGELARLSRVAQPTMTNIVKRLGEQNWIERTADPADRRVQALAITAAGSTALQEWHGAIASALLPRFGDLTARQRAVLAQASELLAQRVDVAL